MYYEKRSIPVAIILTIITCGIYGIYWYYCIARAFYNANTPNRVATSPGVVILLDIITCGIYGHYMYYKWGKQTPEIFYLYGRYGEDRSTLYLLLSLIIYIGLPGNLVNMALIQNDFNQLADAGPPNTGGPGGYGAPSGNAYPPPPQGGYGYPSGGAYAPPESNRGYAPPYQPPTPPPAPPAGPGTTAQPDASAPPVPDAPPPPPFYPHPAPQAPEPPPPPPGSPYDTSGKK